MRGHINQLTKPTQIKIITIKMIKKLRILYNG